MFSMCASAGVVGGMFLCSRLEVPFLNQAQGSSSSLPPLKPFQKQLYYSSQTHGTEKENQDDVPIVIQGIDPVSTLCIKTCHAIQVFLKCELGIGALYDNMSNVALIRIPPREEITRDTDSIYCPPTIMTFSCCQTYSILMSYQLLFQFHCLGRKARGIILKLIGWWKYVPVMLIRISFCTHLHRWSSIIGTVVWSM